TIVFAAALSQSSSKVKNQPPIKRVGSDEEDDEDRGTIQVQGKDIRKDPPATIGHKDPGPLVSNPSLMYGSGNGGEGTVSWSWAQKKQKGVCYPPAELAIEKLGELQDAITPAQVKAREKGWSEVEEAILQAQRSGGMPVGPTRSFPKRPENRSKKYPEAR